MDFGAFKDGFLDELEKIAAFGMEGAPPPPKPGQVFASTTLQNQRPKTINQSVKSSQTGYTQSNVEAPGTDISVAMPQKMQAPPPIRT